MATVYLAEDLKHDRKVALKVLKPELAAVLGAERFLAEIKTTANLQHPHILPLFDSGEADGFLFYVMPYVEGETLRDKLDREKQLGVDEAVRIATRGGRRARLRAPARRHPPGHQAGEHPAARRPADGGRLRHRAGRECGGRRPDDRDGAQPRHAALHESGAGDRETGDRRAGATCTRWAACCTRCWRASRRTRAPRPRQIIVKILTEEAAPVTQLRKTVPPNVAAAVAQGAREAAGRPVRERQGVRRGARQPRLPRDHHHVRRLGTGRDRQPPGCSGGMGGGGAAPRGARCDLVPSHAGCQGTDSSLRHQLPHRCQLLQLREPGNHDCARREPLHLSRWTVAPRGRAGSPGARPTDGPDPPRHGEFLHAELLPRRKSPRRPRAAGGRPPGADDRRCRVHDHPRLTFRICERRHRLGQRRLHLRGGVERAAGHPLPGPRDRRGGRARHRRGQLPRDDRARRPGGAAGRARDRVHRGTDRRGATTTGSSRATRRPIGACGWSRDSRRGTSTSGRSWCSVPTARPSWFRSTPTSLPSPVRNSRSWRASRSGPLGSRTWRSPRTAP